MWAARAPLSEAETRFTLTFAKALAEDGYIDIDGHAGEQYLEHVASGTHTQYCHCLDVEAYGISLARADEAPVP
jgi:hypothetical protein